MTLNVYLNSFQFVLNWGKIQTGKVETKELRIWLGGVNPSGRVAFMKMSEKRSFYLGNKRVSNLHRNCTTITTS